MCTPSPFPKTIANCFTRNTTGLTALSMSIFKLELQEIRMLFHTLKADVHIKNVKDQCVYDTYRKGKMHPTHECKEILEILKGH